MTAAGALLGRVAAGTVLLVVAASVLAAQQTPQRPVFRGGANFVLVDAYPTRGDLIVEGLTAADFQVLEDGKPQRIEAFEFVRATGQYAIADRKDPNSQREALVAAADPHNRVLVVFLDVSHVTVDGSHAIRGPLVDGLNRMVAPDDLFGVISPSQRAKDLVLGRLMTSVEEQLSKYWTWGERTGITSSRPLDPREMQLSNCFHQKILPTTIIDWIVDDGPVRRFFDEALIERLREDVALTALEDLVDHLGTLREARTVLIPITDGWVLFGPNRVWESEPVGDVRMEALVPHPANALIPRSAGEALDFQKCLVEMNRLVGFQHEKRLRDLIDRANRRNVSFYPVAPSRLAVFDGGGASENVRVNPKAPPGQTVLGRDLNRLKSRQEGLLTLAENTDGIAIVNTNDLAAGFRRIVNDVSAYYLIGYSSTNGAQDGRYRRIEVKTTAPNIRMRARRGYVAAAPASAAAPATAAVTPAVTEAFGQLARLKPSVEVFVAGAVTAGELATVVELPASALTNSRWSQGGAVTLDVTDARGGRIGEATGLIPAGARAVLLRMPITGTSPWRVRARVTGGPDGVLEERFDLATTPGTVVGGVVAYRATPAPASPIHPVADFQYRRTERVHLEWARRGPIDRQEARLVGRNGLPLPVPVRLSERETDGRPVLAADVNLAPLSAGDYLVELTVSRGGVTEVKHVAIRVTQ